MKFGQISLSIATRCITRSLAFQIVFCNQMKCACEKRGQESSSMDLTNPVFKCHLVCDDFCFFVHFNLFIIILFTFFTSAGCAIFYFSLSRSSCSNRIFFFFFFTPENHSRFVMQFLKCSLHLFPLSTGFSSSPLFFL